MATELRVLNYLKIIIFIVFAIVLAYFIKFDVIFKFNVKPYKQSKIKIMTENKSDYDYDHAYAFLFKHEIRPGKTFSNDPDDPGGPTNYGVSLRFLKDVCEDINLDGLIDINDVLALDSVSAKNIFKKYWWDKYGYGKLNNLSISSKIFDLSVNMGSFRAHEILQKAINKTDPKVKLFVDGLIGPITIMTANKICAVGFKDVLLENIKDLTRQFYKNLVKSNPRNAKFLPGWLNRANDQS